MKRVISPAVRPAPESSRVLPSTTLTVNGTSWTDSLRFCAVTVTTPRVESFGLVAAWALASVGQLYTLPASAISTAVLMQVR